MSGSAYNGLPANVAPPAALSIQSSTNATPIVIQTSTNHGMITGDYVDINNHQTNVSANGIWPVVVIDATHFSLTGSSGTAAGGATGNAQPLTFTGNVSLNPANGDAMSAGTWIPGMSCLADRTAWLALQTGAFKVVSQNFLFRTDHTGSDWGTVTTSALGTFTNFSTTWAVQTNADLQASDIVLVDLDVNIAFDRGTQSPSYAMLALASSQEPPGAAPVYSTVSGSARHIPTQLQTTPLTQNVFPVHLSGQYVGGIAGQGLVQLQAMWNSGSSSGSVVFHALGDYLFRATVLRPTGWPQ